LNLGQYDVISQLRGLIRRNTDTGNPYSRFRIAAGSQGCGSPQSFSPTSVQLKSEIRSSGPGGERVDIHLLCVANNTANRNRPGGAVRGDSCP
jgi:hypothetical protein